MKRVTCTVFGLAAIVASFQANSFGIKDKFVSAFYSPPAQITYHFHNENLAKAIDVAETQISFWLYRLNTLDSTCRKKDSVELCQIKMNAMEAFALGELLQYKEVISLLSSQDQTLYEI